MLSRVASALYWMARYIERAENTARLVNVNTNLVLDLPKGISAGWRPLVNISGSESLFRESYSDVDERSVVKFLIGDLTNPGSIQSSLYLARENARTVRDIMPREAWEGVNDLYLFAKSHLQKGLSQRGRYDYLKEIIHSAQFMTGLLAGTMSNDYAYDFLRIGRNLERADMTTRIIDVRSASLLPDQPELTPFENIQWMSVLKSLSGYQMYRRHMQVRVRRPAVLRFLFQDRAFPRSFYHCICEAEASLEHLPRREGPIAVVAETKRLVQNVDIANLEQQALHRFIDDLQLALGSLHEQITTTYFVVAPRVARAG